MQTDPVIEIIQQARSRIADPANYLRDSASQTADGQLVSPHDPRAVRFDLFGAVASVMGVDPQDKAEVMYLLQYVADPECQRNMVAVSSAACHTKAMLLLHKAEMQHRKEPLRQPRRMHDREDTRELDMRRRLLFATPCGGGHLVRPKGVTK